MKTLVIHPYDPTTYFLSVIYADKDWTVIRENPSRKKLVAQIKANDRIVMLGHGSNFGLLGFKRMIIDPSWVYLLREKQCVCIWCNADQFVVKYGLKGFYTGMIVSEYDEAVTYCLYPVTLAEITESNTLFADSISKAIDSPNMLEEVKGNYDTTCNSVIEFNKDNIYSNVE